MFSERKDTGDTTPNIFIKIEIQFVSLLTFYFTNCSNLKILILIVFSLIIVGFGNAYNVSQFIYFFIH